MTVQGNVFAAIVVAIVAAANALMCTYAYEYQRFPPEQVWSNNDFFLNPFFHKVVAERCLGGIKQIRVAKPKKDAPFYKYGVYTQKNRKLVMIIF